ncbi:DNA-binding MarR family transcriptional regulator [Herbihabitans rhizosphaerae]|uniref:DNA-binding MarR family transcriptional regulator n=1 Tax=Herbihabitans rhizosphaerae TaxID=1872711 RepID=A0A4Q7L394_9PSEU|nr:MarR family winged helix-turn-helix transcriptional regulator [Herbihabitans rhizosphaerae]RZS43707.1 DNA-binding MarR family transcriptional regulator [Herbihabitans rhizosphaerae]
MNETTAELAKQPIGYWTGLAHEAIIRHINAAHARFGNTQRHWMALNMLSRNDGRITRIGLGDLVRPFVTPTIGDRESVDQVIEDLIDRRWISVSSDGLLHLTEQGRAGRARTMVDIKRVRAEIHAGVTDEEYARTLGVLRRMIANVGGDPSLPG